MNNYFAFLVIFLLSGCGAHVGEVHYLQPDETGGTKSQSCRKITIIPFTDSRPHGAEVTRMIGELNGGFGETLKSIETVNPLNNEVSATFVTFLNQAGCDATIGEQTSQNTLLLEGNITDFWGLFAWTHKLSIEIDLKLTDSTTGQETWKGTLSGQHGGHIMNKFPQIKDDPLTDCLGYDCHAHAVNVALNLLLSEALIETWEEKGFREATQK